MYFSFKGLKQGHRGVTVNGCICTLTKSCFKCEDEQCLLQDRIFTDIKKLWNNKGNTDLYIVKHDSVIPVTQPRKQITQCLHTFFGGGEIF